jgi:uncharacterized protein (TIGR02145 family)
MKTRFLIFALITFAVLQSCQKNSESSKVSDTSTVTDIENNIYKTAKIGTQTWMAENLKTTKITDGTSIPLIIDNTWGTLKAPAYCWYNNDVTVMKMKYGALYNWYSVSNSKLCPTGWHVPSKSDWTTLVTYVGGENVAGGKLKENIAFSWKQSSVISTNEYGFSALPGGYRNIWNEFTTEFSNGDWWSSTPTDYAGAGILYGMDYVTTKVYEAYNGQPSGYSVRCIKN